MIPLTKLQAGLMKDFYSCDKTKVLLTKKEREYTVRKEAAQ